MSITSSSLIAEDLPYIDGNQIDMIDTETFREDVYQIVCQIPKGHVLSYGDVGRLVGYPNHSRLVGRVMKECPIDSKVPCHRVVNSDGRCSCVFRNQKELLTEEGVRFTSTGNVDMKGYRWNFNEVE